MLGNVWERCHDEYESYGGDATDPVGTDSDRVVRGGSWVDHARLARVASRYYNVPGDRDLHLGLRPVGSLP
jgi:formylglycine-generating enzyme required for sulfatase activity